MSGNPGSAGYLNDVMDAMEREAIDRQPSSVFCAHCPSWEHVGTAAECRAAFAEHRKAHPTSARTVKRVVCARHDCERLTKSPSGMCPEHLADTRSNARNRVGGARNQAIVRRSPGRLNREDLPTWA